MRQIIGKRVLFYIRTKKAQIRIKAVTRFEPRLEKTDFLHIYEKKVADQLRSNASSA